MEVEAQPAAGSKRMGDQFAVRMPDGMRDRLRNIAADSRRSMNAQIVVLLEEGIKRHVQGEAQ